MLIVKRAIKALVEELRPGTRVSTEYLDGLDASVRRLVTKHMQINGGKKTLKADVFLGLPAQGRGRH